MKRLSFIFVALLWLSVSAQYQGKIQIAILFDTSNSMDGLIDQAKSRIWSIVNTMSNLRYQGQTPAIEIALYDYGNDNIPAANNHVRQILPFTGDLDLVSQKLFGLTTRGGQEYCGAVISNSLAELKWNGNPNDLKMIYIAGNEPFNQGPVAYKEVCALAAQRSIYVNTIYCGDYQQGITEFWYDGAQQGKGEYSNINPNLQVKHYDTPYDEKIRVYNDSLNRTYMGYGSTGKSKKNAQAEQDKNAEEQSVQVLTERAVVKSKSVYKNDSWDLVDANVSDSTLVKRLTKDELPDELKGKSEAEIKVYLDEQKVKRSTYQKMIGELSVEREKYITEQKKNEPEGTESDFGKEVQKNVLKVANEKGFEVEKK
ncbi:MAG: hypothetical protein K0R65_1940 [Crocinitomicaceae bacterium]|jgi:hypothetical protein|nr:hypothetical protein [Crocinitomicaceae bacterium]